MQAEPHSVMVGDEGGLFDVTATVDREKQVLFLPDMRNGLPKINGRYIENYKNVLFPSVALEQRRVPFWTQSVFVTVAGTPQLSVKEKAIFGVFTF